ncbi:uncharacterized protein TRIVIDRAFT_65122 [Trichoderma virens Gv29-8]|uniref:Uncharacterized protein n=1 Tax=Hypocrea virens (strain Gv29-8 / FGSC 10586) TaxID=413071 RepID=G9NB47_HYPVG|nr:uncharacterized protein TRIVIDRAFT_65122 [Trichoderma virens Gv29-8]EHK16055.1 hypothetical protein TRIVIDRAFT_65122 [Trichoderma virens Gv29-8]
MAANGGLSHPSTSLLQDFPSLWLSSTPPIVRILRSFHSGKMPATSQAEKRRLRFAANQAKLSPEQLELQRLQNHASSERFQTANTIYALRQAKRWFTEFMKDQYPEVDVVPAYFTPGASLPATSLLKQYARYLVRSRVGGLNEKLSVKTVNHYMAMIMSIIERECKHDSLTAIRREVNNFVHNDLINQEGIRTAMHTKSVAHTEDVTFILSKLYSPEYLNRFPDMRTVLNLTLYIVLVVDLCGRGSEIARNPSRPVHQCLHWEDVEFYTFQRIDDNEFDIRVNIKVRWSKGQTADESRYHTVPFTSLLPPSMALEDTLRLLLTLALIDGVFDYGITTWEDLASLRLPPHIAKTGRRIAIKKEFLSVPVLRKMDQKHRLTTDPVLTVDMQAHIRKLGQYCGLENRLVAYCFRRGAAYTLATFSNDSNGSPGAPGTANTLDAELGAMAESMVEPHLLDDTAWDEATALEEERLSELTSAKCQTEETIDQNAELPTDGVQKTTNNALQSETDDPSMALHGAPDHIVGKGIGRIKMKGVSAYNDMLADIKGAGDDEAALCGVMMSWFKVTHGIDTFWAGQEPLPGTYACRFCGIDLVEVHHPDEHCYKCSQKDAIQRATSLRDGIFPLNQPCQYQVCGHGDQLYEFVTCGKTFTTIKEQGDHMRSHVRTMQKTGANGDKVPTCFFGGCAKNPEGGRIRRDGPDFDSFDDLLDHVWSVHHVYTVKSNEVKFCEYCQTWLIEPLEWRSHAERHLNDARNVVAKHGYTGVTVGRAIVPRICPFCFHDEQSPTQKRIATHASFYDLSTHISLHLEDHEKQAEERTCPCFPAMCTKAEKMDSTKLRTHLEIVHGIEAKTKTTAKRRANTDDSAGSRTRAKNN